MNTYLKQFLFVLLITIGTTAVSFNSATCMKFGANANPEAEKLTREHMHTISMIAAAFAKTSKEGTTAAFVTSTKEISSASSSSEDTATPQQSSLSEGKQKLLKQIVELQTSISSLADDKTKAEYFLKAVRVFTEITKEIRKAQTSLELQIVETSLKLIAKGLTNPTESQKIGPQSRLSKWYTTIRSAIGSTSSLIRYGSFFVGQVLLLERYLTTMTTGEEIPLSIKIFCFSAAGGLAILTVLDFWLQTKKFESEGKKN